MWDEEHPAARFMKRLVRERAEEMLTTPQFMRFLRNDNETAVRYQRKFGKVWREHGTNVYKLIAKACGDAPWDGDSEDEEKGGGAVVAGKKVSPHKEKNHDDVARTREESALLGIDLLQGKSEESIKVVEREVKGSSGEEEEKGRQGGGRREDFYRRAGGSAPQT